MFKKLREKLADEAVGEVKEQEFPGDGLSNEQQFSITEDDGTSSEMGSPQRDLNATASSSKVDDLDSSLFVPVLGNHNTARSTYIPPSDLESEVEDPIQTPPILDDSITKEQLFLALTKLHARVQRYKTKYSKVAEACKTANAEKEKIMKTLASNQDQMLRRMSELREQCNLEKQAKAHLEENLRLMLDEKEDMIGVLKTKIDLLKGGQNPDLIDEDVKSTKSIDSFSISEDQDCDKKSVRSQDDNSSKDSESIAVLENKVKRLEELLSRCKNALQSNKERSEQLTLERDRLADQLEQKEQELLKIQEEESNIQANLRTELSEMSERLNKLRKEQEEMGMAMAETKRSFHQELETREQRLADTQKDLNKAKDEISKIQQQWQDETIKVQNLSAELEKMEKSLDEEKDEMIKKLSESKSAAIALLKEQHQKSLKEIEDECKRKIDEAEKNVAEIEKENTAKLNENNAFIERLKDETSVTVSELNQKIEKLTDELNLKSQNLSEQNRLTDLVNSLQTQIEDLKLVNEKITAETSRKYSDLERELIKTNHDLENILTEKNNITAEKETLDTNLNNFVNAIQDHTLPLFNKFDDLKLDKNDLNALSASLKVAVDRFTIENSKMVDEIQRLTNENESLTEQLKKVSELQSEIDVLKNTSGNIDEVKNQLLAVENLLEKSTQDYEKLRFKYDETVSCNECKEIELKKELEALRGSLIDKENHIAILNERCTASDNEILNLKSSLEELENLKNLNSKLENEIKKLIEVNTANIDDIAIKDGVITSLNVKSDELQNEIMNLRNKFEIESANTEKLTSQLEKAVTERDNLIKAIEEGSSGNEMLSNELESTKNKLQQFEVDNIEKSNRLSEMEMRVKDLNAELNETKTELIKAVEGWNMLVNELETTKNQLQQLESDNIEKTNRLLQSETLVKDLNAKLDETKSELIKAVEERTALVNEVEATKNQLQQLETENMEKTNRLLQMETQVNDLNSELNENKSELLKAVEERTALVNEVEATKNQLQQLEVDNKEKTNRLSEMETRVDDLNGELNENKSELIKSVEERSTLVNELETTKSKLQQLETENMEKTNRLSQMESQIKAINTQLNETKWNLMKTIEDGSSGNESMKIKIRELEAEKTDKLNKLTEMEDKFNESRSELTNLIERISGLESEKTKLQSLYTEKSEEAETLEIKLQESVNLTEKFRKDLELNEEKILELEEECLQLRDNNSESQCIIQKLDSIRSELNDLRREKTELESTFAERCELHESEKTKAANKIKELRAQIGEIELVSKERCRELEEKLSHLDKKNKENEVKMSEQSETIESKNLELVSLESEVREKDNTISEISEEKRNLDAALKTKIEANSILESKITELGTLNSSEYEILKQRNDDLEKEHVRLRVQLEEREDNLRKMEETLTSARQACVELETKLQERETSNDRNETEEILANLRQQIDQKNLEIEAMGIELSSVMGRNVELEKNLRDIEEARLKMNTFETEISELKEKLIEATEKHDAALRQKEETYNKEIQSKEELIASLQEDVKIRNIQLDECLVVSEVNTSGIAQELEISKEKLEELSKENSLLKQELSSNSAIESPFETSLIENVTLNNDEDYETRLKKLVKFFSAQMKKKEEEYERELGDIKERYLELEEKLVYEKDQNVTGIEKRLAEQSGAIEEMREHFLIQIQEKDEIIMMLQKENNIPPKSDWDNNWEYEEESADNVGGEDSIRHKHDREVKQSTKSETMSSNISVCANGTDSVNRNNFGDLSTGLEPTEYLYLRNILLEYMMGKEPVTLAKVIAAVLRFPKDLTSQILKREEARQHSTITTPSPDS